MKLFVTVAEPAADDALAAIRNVNSDHDGIEVRAEHFVDAELDPFRAATGKLLLYTVRGRGPITASQIERAIHAGFDLVDVEWSPDLNAEVVAPYLEKIVLSHHDYDGMHGIPSIVAAMRGFGCRYVKVAATPSTMQENLDLLALSGDGVSVIGMGERGLYTRIAAPFRGSELTFVAPDEAHAAAPGQLALSPALAIFGPSRERLSATHLFAVAGNPAGHSLSPAIHNPLFRTRGADAAYGIASVATFGEVTPLLLSGELTGISVTAPFKHDALAWAERLGLSIGENARLCGAANTVVMGTSRIADNTDVDGFVELLTSLCGRDRKTAAIVGAGGTARAALLACARVGLAPVVFNRTRSRAEALAAEFSCAAGDLHDLASFDGEIIIDTTPSSDFDVRLGPAMTLLRAAYGSPSPVEIRARAAGANVITGLELLHAQAARQNEMFLQAIS